MSADVEPEQEHKVEKRRPRQRRRRPDSYFMRVHVQYSERERKIDEALEKNTPKVQKTFTPVVIETNDYSEEEEYPANWWIPVRPAIGGNVVSASADYDYDTCPN